MGSSIAAQEANLMFKTVANTFPFNYLTQTSFNHVILAGLAMFVIGVIIKVLTTPSRAELTKDFGKILIVPGIIGVISIVGIQLLTTRSINSLFLDATLRTAETTVNQANAGLLVWNMMGSLFLMGILMLFFGYILTYTIKKIGGKPVSIYLLGDFMVIMGWFTFAFYLLFRLLAVEFIAKELYGTQMLKLFTLMWYVSRSGFLASVGLFAFGLVLYKYGKKLHKTAYGRQRPEFAKLAAQTTRMIDQTIGFADTPQRMVSAREPYLEKNNVSDVPAYQPIILPSERRKRRR